MRRPDPLSVTMAGLTRRVRLSGKREMGKEALLQALPAN